MSGSTYANANADKWISLPKPWLRGKCSRSVLYLYFLNLLSSTDEKSSLTDILLHRYSLPEVQNCTGCCFNLMVHLISTLMKGKL